MSKVIVTGTSGLLGPHAAQHFIEHGYDVLSLDMKEPRLPVGDFRIVNLRNLGECISAMQGADAIVHLAAIPRPGITTNEVTFENNAVTTYNILEAANILGIRKAVIASSECSYGVVNSKNGLQPAYVPIDEDHPQLPDDCYGLSKIVNEATADAFHRLNGMQVVSFRIGNVIDDAKYKNFPGFIHDSAKRKSIMWSYIDVRDIASACRLAIEKDNLGSIKLNLAADDSSMDIKSIDLMKAEYPDVIDIRSPIDEYQTLYSNKRAKEVLGWVPQHTWRSFVSI